MDTMEIFFKANGSNLWYHRSAHAAGPVAQLRLAVGGPRAHRTSSGRDKISCTRRKRLPKNKTPHAGLLPPGFSAEHLGPNDYYYWDNFWALAGLKAAAEMVKRNGLESKSTEISICTQCKGTWLATGQFLNLINALLDEANQKPAPELVKISLQQAKEMLTNPD